MPRIPEVPVTEAGLLTGQLHRFARERYGAVPRPMSGVRDTDARDRPRCRARRLTFAT